MIKRRCSRYQRGNQNLYIEEQTAQWPKEKVQKDKQWSTKHTHKTKDRVTRTPQKTGGELRCSGWVSRFCSTSGTRRVNLVTNPVISNEWGEDREMFTTSGTYSWSFVTQIFHNCQPSHGGDRKFMSQTVQCKRRYLIWCTGRFSGKTFIWYAHSLKTGKHNDKSHLKQVKQCVTYYSWPRDTSLNKIGYN